MSNICCMLLVLSLFHRGKNMWSLKFCWPNLSCVSCSGLVCIFLQWLLWVCAEEMSKRKIVCTPGEWIWLLIILFSFFLHINTTQASKKYLTFLENSFVHVRRAHFFLYFTPCMRKSNIMVTVSLDCSTQQILSVGESSADPQRSDCRFSIYDQTLPMLYHAVHFINLISALLQTVSDAFSLTLSLCR